MFRRNNRQGVAPETPWRREPSATNRPPPSGPAPLAASLTRAARICQYFARKVLEELSRTQAKQRHSRSRRSLNALRRMSGTSHLPKNGTKNSANLCGPAHSRSNCKKFSSFGSIVAFRPLVAMSAYRVGMTDGGVMLSLYFSLRSREMIATP